MGQSATIVEISKSQFIELSKSPDDFKPEMALNSETFEKNFEGVLFLLHKVENNFPSNLVDEIFYPLDFLGESIDPQTIDPENPETWEGYMEMEEKAIPYLTQEKVSKIDAFLSGIEENEFLDQYDPEELNDHQVYPGIWHSDESPNMAFNKKDIGMAFRDLRRIFKAAAENGNIVLVRVG